MHSSLTDSLGSLRRTVCSFAGIVALTTSPYGCHKPTLQEQYADARRCFAALDANLKFVTAEQFRRVGLDRDAVDLVFREEINNAFDLGKPIGMKPAAITADLQRASAAYTEAHTWQPQASSRRKFSAIGYDVNDCLADFYGRPND